MSVTGLGGNWSSLLVVMFMIASLTLVLGCQEGDPTISDTSQTETAREAAQSPISTPQPADMFTPIVTQGTRFSDREGALTPEPTPASMPSPTPNLINERTTPTPTPTLGTKPTQPGISAPTQPATSAPASSIAAHSPWIICGPSDYRPPLRYQQNNFLHWAPDGLQLIFLQREKIWRVDLKRGDLQEVVDVNPYTEPAYSGYKDWPMEYPSFASFSPDGFRIVYSTCEYQAASGANRQGGSRGYEIAMINIDGTGKERLTRDRRFDNYPVWSPDGTKIAFVSNVESRRPNGNNQLLVIDENSKWRKDKARIIAHHVATFPPVWSPDGDRIAFRMYEKKNDGVVEVMHSVRADGSEMRRIGEATTLASWSPDGERIAFGTSDEESVVIYTARYDGTDQLPIWSSGPDAKEVSVRSVDWSPDGSEILVVSATQSNRGTQIWTLTPDGKQRRRLGSSESQIMFDYAGWSPDGSRIAAYGIHGPMTLFSPKVVTLARDGTDIRPVVASHPRSTDTYRYLTGLPYAVNPTGTSEPADPAACHTRLVVPDPKDNPGLVYDCKVLLRVRDELAGSATLNWSADVPILEWEGVEFDGNPQRVRKLVLPDWGLTGTIPFEIGLLTELTRLILHSEYGPIPNFLTGPIPAELGNLRKLEILSLDGNFLSGGIPEELGQLENLQIMWIGLNFLGGCIPEGLRDIERHDFEDTGLVFCGEVEAEVQ